MGETTTACAEELNHDGIMKPTRTLLLLLVPLAALHAKAEQEKNYASIVRATTLSTNTEGTWTTLSIPTLIPSGILMVEKMS